MEKIFSKGNQLLLLILLASTYCSGKEHKRQGHSNCKIEINEYNRGSPTDSAQWSIQMNGTSNTLKINDKEYEISSDTGNNQDSIQVNGTCNSITIRQSDQQSKVSISQQGKNNKISIIQQ